MNPKKNIPYLRYKFFSYNQNEDQNIDDYVTELKLKSSHCEFGKLKESLIRDRIVAGTKDKRVQERLFREPDLTLDKAIAICRAAEETKKQSEEMQAQSPSSNINQVRHRRPRVKQNERKNVKIRISIKDGAPLLENYAKNARNAITLLKYVGPNKQRELKISISERDSSDENANGFFVDSVSQSENPQSQNKTTDKQYVNILPVSRRNQRSKWYPDER